MPNSHISGQTTGAAHNGDLIYWINRDVLIAGLPLKQELYACVAIVAAIYQEWRPGEPEWRSVHLGAQDQRLRLSADAHRHMARDRPDEANALYGDIQRYPVHAAFIEAGAMSSHAGWCRLLALFAWPHIAPRAFGATVNVPSLHHIRRFGQLLRDAGAAGRIPNPVIEELWTAWSALDGVTPTRSVHFDTGTWAAIQAHVDAYRSTRREESQPQANSTPAFVWRGPFDLAIDSNRMAEEESEALAPEDAAARLFATEDEGSADDCTDALSRVFRNIFEGERAFQHLPLNWERVSPREVTALKQAFTKLDEQEKLGIALCICLSIPPEALPSLMVRETFEHGVEACSDGKWHLCATSTGAIVAVHGIQVPEHAYRRKDEAGYRPRAPVSVVGLPWFASKTIKSIATAGPSMLLRYFPDISPVTRAAGESLRQATGARLTFGRLQEVVADAMFAMTQDECLVARAIPTSSILVGSGIYYSAYPAMRLYRAHAQAIDNTLGWNSPPPAPEIYSALRHTYVGSELTIAPRALRSALDALYRRTQASIRIGRYTPERVVDAINAICTYTLAVLCLLTGHRPTNEPFPVPEDIRPELGSALICDKRQFGSHEQREVPLTGVAAAQFAVYLEAIEAIAGYLDREFGQVAAQLRSLLCKGPNFPSAALFSILELESGRLTIRPFKRADWTRFWPEWGWPVNGGRHYLMQELNSRRICRELISYLFGHAEPGQTAFNRQSAIAPQTFFDEIEPALADIARALGIRVSGTPKAYAKGTSATPPTMVGAQLFGDAARAARRPLTRDAKRFVRQLLTDFDEQRAGLPFRMRRHVADRFHGDRLLAHRVLRLLVRCSRGMPK